MPDGVRAARRILAGGRRAQHGATSSALDFISIGLESVSDADADADADAALSRTHQDLVTCAEIEHPQSDVSARDRWSIARPAPGHRGRTAVPVQPSCRPEVHHAQSKGCRVGRKPAHSSHLRSRDHKFTCDTSQKSCATGQQTSAQHRSDRDAADPGLRLGAWMVVAATPQPGGAPAGRPTVPLCSELDSDGGSPPDVPASLDLDLRAARAGLR